MDEYKIDECTNTGTENKSRLCTSYENMQSSLVQAEKDRMYFCRFNETMVQLEELESFLRDIWASASALRACVMSLHQASEKGLFKPFSE